MIRYSTKFDVIVIGAGHAGIEAAMASARMGMNVMMMTLDPTKIGQMSCNPSIGGTAKGQLVREIDALGGEMGRAADQAAMQFRMLNRGKGPAVWSPRAQCDRGVYRTIMTQNIQNFPNIHVLSGDCVDIFVDNSGAAGVVDGAGRCILSKAVVIATGTFLRGRLHCGLNHVEGGRRGEPAAFHLTGALQRLGYVTARLKTGTPMRLDGTTINYAKCEIQPGDPNPIPFSWRTRSLPQKQIPCWLTYTNQRTHHIIRDNLDRSPTYSGKIAATGVRYCPSIEDKVVKFPHHERHHLFVEPEGYFTDEVYINGLSTGLPEDVQENMVRSVSGFEDAKFIRYGYAVEYDFCPPLHLKPTLESKLVPGLFFAGQINGTTGYEEAAGQGLMAGINASLAIKGEPPLVIGRDEGYLGVMIDDLVTKGVDEPYRVLTSRAEYRLHLRWDNADLRLMDYGRRIGLIDAESHEDFRLYRRKVEEMLSDRASLGSPMEPLSAEGPDPMDSFSIEEGPWSADRQAYQVWVQHKYSGYLAKQKAEIVKFRKMEGKRIPDDFDYATIPGLLLETREKFRKIRPRTVGQASRIPGIPPSDIGILLVYLRRFQKESAERKMETEKR